MKKTNRNNTLRSNPSNQTNAFGELLRHVRSLISWDFFRFVEPDSARFDGVPRVMWGCA
jgi:hypothetical protein